MNKTFILEGISIDRPYTDVFNFVSDRYTLPAWTKAFKTITPTGALYATPDGAVQIGLDVVAERSFGIVDWVMKFPDETVERAFSRVVVENADRTNVQFFFAPNAPPDKLTAMIAQFSSVIREEFSLLKTALEEPAKTRSA